MSSLLYRIQFNTEQCYRSRKTCEVKKNAYQYVNTAPCFGEPRQEQQIGRKTVSILLIPDQWQVRHSNFRYYYLRLELTRWPKGQKAANLKSRPVLRSAQLLRYTVRYSVVTLQRVLSFCHTA